MSADFRRTVSGLGLRYAMGILPTQKVYPLDVKLHMPAPRGTGRPRKHPIPWQRAVSVEETIDALGEHAFRTITWREGTKGALSCDFAAIRIRVADGVQAARGQHLPGGEAWLVCERRASGERKYYLCNHPPRTWLRTLARAIKARWSCEHTKCCVGAAAGQAHQQMKAELGLDHYEGRGWRGLHNHALMSMLAFAFLQNLRLRGKAHAG